MRSLVVVRQVVAFVVVFVVLVAGSVAAGHVAYERLTVRDVVTVPRLVEAAPGVTSAITRDGRPSRTVLREPGQSTDRHGTVLHR